MWVAAKGDMAAETERQPCPCAMAAPALIVKGTMRVPGH